MPRFLPGVAFLLFAFAAPGRVALAQQSPLPIIDMHLHARTAHHYGPNPGPLCAPVDRMPVWDPAIPFADALEKSAPPCRFPVAPAATDADVLGQTIAVMKRRNIIGMLGGRPALVAKWMAAAPGRFIPGLDFRLDRDGGTASAVGNPKDFEALSPQAIRELHRKGSLAVFGEVLNQYGGIAPDDPRMEPYWALAEDLDVPVGIHLGPGGRSAGKRSRGTTAGDGGAGLVGAVGLEPTTSTV